MGMVMKVTSLDNINQKVLDALVEKYKDDPIYRISDERKSLSFGKPREYFLIANDGRGRNSNPEWTFIWIGDNLWQFRYINTQCNSKSKWENPIDILNKLLND
jgi:hypothetical protein